MRINLTKLIIAALLLLLAVVSCLYVADWASAPETHRETAAALEEKAETVLRLSAAAALVSSAVTLLPGDVGTPIADELADFTTYFLLVLTILMAEKYLVSILGLAAFRILIPLGLVLAGLSLFCFPKRLRALAIKLAVVGLAVFLVIPLSLRVSDVVYRAYTDCIQDTVETAEILSDDAMAFSGAEGDSSLLGILTNKLNTWRQRAVDALNRFLQTLAVMIVTSCVIPILVLLFFFWLIKQLTGLDLAGRLFPLPRRRAKPLPEPETPKEPEE